ncbi:MAG TPA: hypothetical protein VFW03_26825 [Gemmatimonadaceae bacterium]|nr:hypothetical protein [Gemmatimonadaceae bacterium]
MSRRTIMLLAAGAIAGGCSRDGPLVPPQVETEEAAVVARQLGPEEAIAARSPAPAPVVADPIALAVDDALNRLLPALGDYGTALRSKLLVLKANRSEKVTLDDLRRAVSLLASTIPAPYRGDLDALRLELGAVTN